MYNSAREPHKQISEQKCEGRWNVEVSKVRRPAGTPFSSYVRDTAINKASRIPEESIEVRTNSFADK